MELERKKDFECSFCSFKCDCNSSLEEHMRNHTREKPFVCEKCGRGFSIKGNLTRHILYMHQEELSEERGKKYKCSLCSYAAHHQYKLNEHMVSHTGERNFPCQHPNCEYSAKKSAELRQHTIRKHQENVRKLLCPVPNCVYRGKTKKELRSHSITHSECTPFVCVFKGCSYKSKLKGNLTRHKLFVHNDGYKPFACSVCNYRTSFKYLLRNHELTHAKENSVKCDFTGCLYSGKSKTALRSHVLNHHTEWTIKCDFVGCSRILANRSTLEQHKKIVHYGKTYKCPSCNYLAANSQLLKSHTNRHKPGIMCSTKGCTLKFKNCQSMRTHMQRHEENLVCPVDGCGLVRFSKAAWKLHMKVHDPLGRPFHCPLCPKHFLTIGHLNSHLKIHTREKAFKCPACDYWCQNKCRMIKHVHAIHSTVFPDFVLDNRTVCNHCGVNFCHAMGLAMHAVKLKTAVVVLARLEVKTNLS